MTGHAARFVCVLSSIAVLLAGGCAGSSPTQSAATSAVQVPTLTPQTETQFKQSKSGLTISIAPVGFKAVANETREIVQARPPTISVITGTGGNIYVAETVKQTPGVTPERLRFLATINNQMPRVFRGGGTVVQFNLDGQLSAVDQRFYARFNNAIVPPRQEQQIMIEGPLVSDLKGPQGVIALNLFDVVTNQSDAGVVTEKQNFEWLFKYDLKPQSVQTTSTRTEKYISVSEYQEIQRKEMTDRQMKMMQQMQPGMPPQAP